MSRRVPAEPDFGATQPSPDSRAIQPHAAPGPVPRLDGVTAAGKADDSPRVAPECCGRSSLPAEPGAPVPVGSPETAPPSPRRDRRPAPAAERPSLDETALAFVDECREHLDDVESLLLRLEGRGSDRRGDLLSEDRADDDRPNDDRPNDDRPDDAAEATRRGLRALHSVKGAVGFLGLPDVSAALHLAESLMAAGGDLPVEETAAVLFDLIDVVRARLDEVVRGVACDTGPTAEVTARLEAALRRAGPRLDRPAAGESSTEASGAPGPDVADRPSARFTVRSDRTGRDAPALNVSLADRREGIPPGEPGPLEPTGLSSGDRSPPRLERTVRVDVGLLDRLMDLVGELVLTRNRLLRAAGSSRSGDLGRFDLVTADLQAAVVQTRLQPLSVAFATLPRLARDVGRATGKEIRLELVGGEVELDRAVLEAVRDPLVHLVRNAIDHGIEPRSERVAAGKDGVGVVRVRATQAARSVVVEVSDDGRGVDTDRVRSRAVEAGLWSPEFAEAASDAEVLSLVFVPGLSTAPILTGVSGRGVGMDVVKSSVEEIGGSVEVRSVAGLGTTVSLRLPLTVVIVSTLVVEVGGGRYVIPLGAVAEMVRASSGSPTLERIGTQAFLRHADELLPIVDLGAELGGGAVLTDDRDGVTLVVMSAGASSVALAVDQVLDAEEIVVKPLHRGLRTTPLVSGATVLGDGRVALVLNPAAVASVARVPPSDPRERSRRSPSARRGPRVVVVEARPGEQLALPLAEVEWLERVDPATLEVTGGRVLARLRGQAVPLVLSGGGGARPTDGPASGLYDVVVVRTPGGPGISGVVVRRIVDVTDRAEVVATGDGRPVVLVGGRVAALVSRDALVAAAGDDRGADGPERVPGVVR